jgi:hopanoid biosynthesis associated RND transporter like protein HpnN
MKELFTHVVAFCCRRAALIVALGVVLGLLAGVFAATHFKMNSDTAQLLSHDLGWRQRQIAFDKLFPQNDDLIVVVIDGVTPERTEQGASALANSLAARTDIFMSIRRPDAGDFFIHNGLLFLPIDKVKATTEQLVKAQSFLGALAADPSLRGIMTSLSTALVGVQHGQARLEDLDKPISAFANVLGDVQEHKKVFFSWQSLFGEGPPDPHQLRKFILAKPRLNYDALSPGAHATDIIRDSAKALHLTPDNGVRVRLTGQIPLSDEEFASLGENIGLILSLMMAAVLLMLWLAVKSVRIIAAILVTLFIGLTITTAFGLLATGALNLISVAFIPLFVGLGVDFGIQFAVRYRAERFQLRELEPSLVAAGHSVGWPLALAALAIAAGFLAFVPTDYKGVAELGLIAGIGMVVAFTLSVTVLPSLLMVLKPRGEAAEIGEPRLIIVDWLLRKHRKRVLAVVGVLTVLGLATMPFLHFDFNPLHLRNPKTESVSTLFDLMKDPQNSPNTIDILTPSLDAADALQKKLSRLPEVAQVLTLKSFIPGDQPAKLAVIRDAQMLLDPTINPFITAPPPSDSENVAALKKAAADLRATASNAQSPAAKDAMRLAGVLDKLAAGSREDRASATDALVSPLNTMLAQIRGILAAQPVTLKSLPPELVRDWTTPDGRARVQVFPSGNPDDNGNLRRFSKAVRAVAPDATGAAISIQESGNTIVGAFVRAGIGSFVIIAILLWLVLRNVRDLAMALASLVFAGLMTLASCVVLGLQINFANIIALPLLFGIGVAFNIYYLMAWCAGDGDLLRSPLARAIVFSALTTASGFGSLWLSSHPGTASMGELLMISLLWTIVTILFILPALLGPPRPART